METEIDAVSLYKPAFGLVKKPFTQAQKLALITFVHSPIGDDLDDWFEGTALTCAGEVLPKIRTSQ